MITAPTAAMEILLGNLVLALGNTQQYSRKKYTLLRHVQPRI
jgi:hypothetical protein